MNEMSFSAQVLRALHAARSPGWMFPAHLLDIVFAQDVSERGAIGLMDVAEYFKDASGQVSKGALAVFADVSMAAAVRGYAGRSVRIATMTLRLSFGTLPRQGRLRSVSRVQFIRRDTGMVVAAVTLQMENSEGEVCCIGEGTFAVLENRQGTAQHPLPTRSTLTGSLTLDELDESEKTVWQRALESEACACPLERFWDYGATAHLGGTEGQSRLVLAKHNSNRSGHLQGGIAAGLLLNACLHTLDGSFEPVDLSLQYQATVDGSHTQVRVSPLKVGRSAAFLIADLTNNEGKVQVSAQCNLIKKIPISQ